MKKWIFIGVIILSIALATICIYGLRGGDDTLDANATTIVPLNINGLFGFVNSITREIIVEPQFAWVSTFSEGLAFVRGVEGREYQTGFVDLEMNLVLPLPAVMRASGFSEGLSFVRGEEGREDQTGFVDIDGNLIIPLPTVIAGGKFSNGFAVIIEREWDRDNENPTRTATPGPEIFIDRSGNKVFGQEFEFADDFREGFSSVRPYGGNWFFIDTTGANTFDMEFQFAGRFVDGFARVELLDGRRRYIDRNGNITRRRW